jgi:hypothetical protein
MRPIGKQFPFESEIFKTSRHNGVQGSIFFTRASSSYESFEGKEKLTQPWGSYNFKDVINAQEKVFDAKNGAGSFVNPLAAKNVNWVGKDIPFDVVLDSRVSGMSISFYHLFEGVAQNATTKIINAIETHRKVSDKTKKIVEGMKLYCGADLPVLSTSSTARYSLDMSNRGYQNQITGLTEAEIATIDSVRRKFQHDDLGLKSSSWSTSGIGDLDMYVGLGKTFDHTLRFRGIDFSLIVGATLPTGKKFDIDNPLSFPFGYESTSFHSDLLLELELKQGWRAGCSLGVTSGHTSNSERRVSVYSEPTNLSPLKFEPKVKTGATLCASPYFTFENINPGVNATISYKYTKHFKDTWADDRENPDVESALSGGDSNEKFVNKTTWTSAHVNLTGTYDPAQRSGEWASHPLLWCSYDHPMGSDTVIRNRKIAVGASVHF